MTASRHDDRVQLLLRRAGDLEQPPPPEVWDRLRAQLQQERGTHTATVSASATQPRLTAVPAGWAEPTAGAVPAEGAVPADWAEPADEAERAPHTSTAVPVQRRRPRAWQLLAAAAVGAGVVWAGGALLSGPAPGDVVATSDLDPLEGSGVEAGGTAEVVEVDARQLLRVQLDEVPDPQDGYLEVWLLDQDVTGMMTLGVLAGDTAEFVLPQGVDLGSFPVVDISREHLDGDPSHGGDSVVRGTLG